MARGLGGIEKPPVMMSGFQPYILRLGVLFNLELSA